MDRAKLKAIMREARRAPPARLAQLYEEVYGAAFAGSVTEERARASIREACDQLLNKETKMAKTEHTINDVMDYLSKIEELLHRALKTPGHIETPPLPESAPGGKKGKAKVTEEFVPEGGKMVQIPTAEELRELATKFTSTFGMPELLKLNQKFGAKKLSEIPKESWATLASEMRERLARHDGGGEKPAEEKKQITIDDIRRVGQEFVTKNGDPAFRALLKAIAKADKISTADPKFYPALFEALTNA